MYILLTDRLICPRCGPGHGLILMASRIENRRVLDGELGCSNCREQYPVRDGFADLRPRPAAPLEAPDQPPEPGERERALRLAALMGAPEGPGFALIVGGDARLAPAIADMIEQLEIVASYAPLAAWSERTGVSRVATGPRLPLTRGAMRAVALTGPAGDVSLEDAARVVSPVGRIVLDPAPADAESRLEAVGFEIAASQEATIVAKRA